MARLNAPLWILATVAVVLFLREAAEVCIPVAIAALLSFALAPIVRALERWHVPRLVAAALLLLALCGAAIYGVYAAGDNVARQIRDLPQTARQVRERMQDGGGSLLARLNRAAEELRGIGDAGRAEPSPSSGGAPSATTALWTGSMSAVTLLGNVVVVAFLIFFFLGTGAAYRPRLAALLRQHLEPDQDPNELLDEITSQIERFIVVRIATAVLVGLATWIALRVVDAPQPALWGVLSAVFNSIPFFGPVIVSGGLFVVGLLARSLGFGVELAFIALVITSLEGWLLTPPLLGHAARMHTLAVFLGLLLWSWIWGIWGTILAVPMLAAVKVVADRVPTLRPLSLLLRE
jgi:predicted PurR-regulated permease PerM